MTLRQQAHGLIDRLPESDIRPMIQIMSRMLPRRMPDDTQARSPKMRAFLDLQEMRKHAAEYGFSEQDREDAMIEKYGQTSWGEADDQSLN